MKARKEDEFGQRATTASRAKNTQIEKFRASLTASKPEESARRAARASIAAERQIRAEQRETERRAAAAKLAAEQAEAAAAAAAQAERDAEAQREADAAREAASIERQERAIALEAEQKAKRDMRYAARKSRK